MREMKKEVVKKGGTVAVLGAIAYLTLTIRRIRDVLETCLQRPYHCRCVSERLWPQHHPACPSPAHHSLYFAKVAQNVLCII